MQLLTLIRGGLQNQDGKNFGRLINTQFTSARQGEGLSRVCVYQESRSSTLKAYLGLGILLHLYGVMIWSLHSEKQFF